MKFKMKIDDLFEIGGKTIFAGLLDTMAPNISKTLCTVEVDGRALADLFVDGEVTNGTGHRDLWTRSKLDFDRGILKQHDMWLVAK
jgi:hypothetical protein